MACKAMQCGYEVWKIDVRLSLATCFEAGGQVLLHQLDLLIKSNIMSLFTRLEE
jgi:hypothetical protein